MPPVARGPVRALVVLNTLELYGLERSVIETFDALRPAVQPVMFVPQAAARYQKEILVELQRRGFELNLQ